MTSLRGRFALVAAMVAAAVALGACGGDDDSAGSTSSAPSGSAATTQAAAGPEDRIAPDAAVGAGLVKLKSVAEKVADASDGDASKAAAEGLETVWRPIEGTVKKNEPDLYLDVEDSFERLASGDLDDARKGEQSLDRAVDAYLAKHPEGAGGANASSGGDDDPGSPESHIAPEAEVTAGLGALKRVGAKVADASDGAGAKAAAEGLEPVWQPIEGTVKKNEPDLYLDIEDSFQRMESGDLDNARKGARAMSAAVDAYLAKHSG